MHSQLDWLKQEENESLREALFKRLWMSWWLKGCQLFRKKKPGQTPILSARKYENTNIVTYACTEGWVDVCFYLLEVERQARLGSYDKTDAQGRSDWFRSKV